MSRPLPAPAPAPGQGSPAGRGVPDPAWRIAAALVAAEGAALAAVSGGYALRVHDEGHGISAWGAAAIGLVVAAVIVGVLARALRRGNESAVAPTVLLQLICLGEAYNMSQENQWAYAVPLALLATATLAATGIGVRRRTRPH